MSTIRYTLRTDKPNKEGLFPVEVIYQISGQRGYYRTKEKLRKENWNGSDQVAIYLDKKTAKRLLPGTDYDLLPTLKEVDKINSNLRFIKNEIGDIEHRFELDKVPYSVEMVLQVLKQNKNHLTKTDQSRTVVFDFIDKYIEDNKASREHASLSVYRSLKNHLQNFQIDKRKKVTFDTIDYAFFLDFQNYLISVRNKRNPTGLGNITIAKILSTLKTFLNYARKQSIEVSNKYKDFTIKKESLEVIALTNEEFEALYNLDLSDNKKLSHVRDVFCFACVTGLRYSDLDQFKREHIRKDEIRLVVTKTRQPLIIPLNPFSYDILSRYEALHRPLPVISNQKTNEYLKELCKKAEINEPVQIVRFQGAKRIENTYPKYELISIHSGRKTFATLSLEKGMSAEEVMKVGGWKDYKSFCRYVKITEQRVKVVMGKAWGEVTRPALMAV